jgi:hypothetical protein
MRDLRRAIQRRTTQPEQVNHELPLRIFLRWLGLYIRRYLNEIFIKQETAQPLPSNLLD